MTATHPISSRPVPAVLANARGVGVPMVGVCRRCGTANRKGQREVIVTVQDGQACPHHCTVCRIWFAHWPMLGEAVHAAEGVQVASLGWRAALDLRPKWKAAREARA